MVRLTTQNNVRRECQITRCAPSLLFLCQQVCASELSEATIEDRYLLIVRVLLWLYLTWHAGRVNVLPLSLSSPHCSIPLLPAAALPFPPVRPKSHTPSSPDVCSLSSTVLCTSDVISDRAFVIISSHFFLANSALTLPTKSLSTVLSGGMKPQLMSACWKEMARCAIGGKASRSRTEVGMERAKQSLTTMRRQSEAIIWPTLVISGVVRCSPLSADSSVMLKPSRWVWRKLKRMWREARASVGQTGRCECLRGVSTTRVASSRPDSAPISLPCRVTRGRMKCSSSSVVSVCSLCGIKPAFCVACSMLWREAGALSAPPPPPPTTVSLVSSFFPPPSSSGRTHLTFAVHIALMSCTRVCFFVL